MTKLIKEKEVKLHCRIICSSGGVYNKGVHLIEDIKEEDLPFILSRPHSKVISWVEQEIEQEAPFTKLLESELEDISDSNLETTVSDLNLQTTVLESKLETPILESKLREESDTNTSLIVESKTRKKIKKEVEL